MTAPTLIRPEENDPVATYAALAALDHAIGSTTDLLDRLDRLMTEPRSVPRLRRDLAELAGLLDTLRTALRDVPAGQTWEQLRGSALDDLRRSRGILDQPHLYAWIAGLHTEHYPRNGDRR